VRGPVFGWLFALRGRKALLFWSAAAYLGLYGAALTRPEMHRYLTGVFYLGPPLIALAFAPGAIARSRGRVRWGLTFLSVTLVAWIAAEAVYSYYALVRDSAAPFPGTADVFYYAGYVALAVAVPLIVAEGGLAATRRSLVDATAVVLVGGTLSWHLLIDPTAHGSAFGDLETVATVGYPLLDLALLVALLVSLYGVRGRWTPQVMTFVASVSLLLMADTAFTAVTLGGGELPQASVLDLGWLASYGLMAGTFLLSGRTVAPVTAGALRPQSMAGLVVPYLAVLPLGGLALAIAGSREALVVSAGAFAACVVLFGRQWLTLVDNRRLQHALERELQSGAELLEGQGRLIARLDLTSIRLAERAEELERLREEAQFAADHDGLTGLLSRRAWFEATEDCAPSALAVFDIDYFKRVNDTLGHPAGDFVLKEVAWRLQALLGGSAILGRLGGEEFGAAFRTGVGVAEDAALGAVSGIGAQPVFLPDGTNLLITISGGFAAWCHVPGGSPQVQLARTYECADAALYEAKEVGRNQLCLWQLARAA